MSEFNKTQPENKLYSYLLDEDSKYRLDTLANAVRFILTLCDESKESIALADGMQAKGVTAIFDILDKEIDGIKNSVYTTGGNFTPTESPPPQFGKGR
ncbi:hypothetical protein D8T09_23795 [Salmonella enterica]|nr:hypothetical protein [Salmonella enterica]